MRWSEALSKASSMLRPEKAFDFLALAGEARKKGIDVISFGIGQPDVPPPDYVIEATREALARGITGYCPAPGLPELREEIARFVNSRYDLDVKPEEVIVTAGAKAAVFMSVMALVNPGDEVLVPDPGYPAYESAVAYVGGKPVPYRLKEEENGWALSLDEIESKVGERTKAIILNSPHNPTGAAFSREEVEAICELALRKGIAVISDEIYDVFTYGCKHSSVLERPEWRDFAVYVNGFSKAFSMTGFRLGYAIAAKPLVERLSLIANNVYSCPVTFAQYGAIEALKRGLEPIKPVIEEYKARRDLMARLLSELPGVKLAPPRGAFYAFPDVSGLMELLGYSDLEQMSKDMLFEAGVLALPGTAFPIEGGRGHMRFSFATSRSKIEEGFRRLREWIEEKMQ